MDVQAGGDLGPALYFSVVQRKVLTPNDFTSLDQLRDRLAAFEAHDNAQPHVLAA